MFGFSTLQIGSLIEAVLCCMTVLANVRFSTLQIGSLIEAGYVSWLALNSVTVSVPFKSGR